jgi:hypothetical protein
MHAWHFLSKGIRFSLGKALTKEKVYIKKSKWLTTTRYIGSENKPLKFMARFFNVDVCFF